MNEPPRTLRQEQEPAGTDVREVAPGVLRLQLPIDMPGLGHVNTYVLPDREGCAVVDPGVPGPANWRTLGHRLADAGFEVGHVHTVVVTHSHPDHFGAAGRLAKEADARLITHSAFRTWWSPRANDPCDEIHDVEPEDLEDAGPMRIGGPTPWGGQGFRPPWRSRMFARLLRSGAGRSAFAAPTPTQRVRDGEPLVLAGREWHAVHTPGHTLDHLCLYDPTEATLLSGDHVLPTITPHISGIATGRDPLAAFVASLDKVTTLGPVRQVLPAHGHPFDDLVGRVKSIKLHHEERLEKVCEIGQSLGTVDVEAYSRELFRPRSWGPMAESETYAHLEHLRLAGQARRQERDGKYLYEVVT